MKRLIPIVAVCAAFSLQAAAVTIVDVIADDFEYGQNAEPSIAVNPSNPQQAFITAFDTLSIPSPIFFTGDGGATWSLFARKTTFDAAVAWPAGGSPYLAHLSGETNTGLIVRKATAPFGATGDFTVLPGASYLPLDVPDQPWIQTVRVGGVDRLYIGINDLSQRSGKTATVYSSVDAGVTWRRTVIEQIASPLGQDAPPVRVAVVGDTVYAAFLHGNDFVRDRVLGDVVIVKDTAGGAHNFRDLGNGGIGVVAAGDRFFTSGYLGQERLGSDLSLAVDPNNPNNVYVAFGVFDADGSPVVQVAASKDGGATWAQVYETRARGALPALAVAGNGTVGLMYTAFLYLKLETHLVQTNDGFSHFSDTVLSRFVDSSLSPEFDPYIGDYEVLVAAGNNFHGVFSASNDVSLWPQPPTFLRNPALLGRRVPFSIDPFYFTSPAISAPPISPAPPTANDDDLIFAKVEEAFAFAALNDVDPAGDILSVKSVGVPSQGTAIKAGTGSVVYTPGRNFTGTDRFTYTIVNSLGQTSTATVHVKNPFFGVGGTFTGLVTNSPAAQPNRGVMNLAVTRGGDFTGALQLEGVRHIFRGEFAIDGSAVATIQRPQGPITLVLTLDFDTGIVSGAISDGLFQSTVVARRAVYPRGTVSSSAGYYTFGLPHDPANLLNTVPHGDGFGTARVTVNGVLRAAIALADGTKITSGVTLTNAGVWPLYALLYRGHGSFSGEVAFSAQPPSDLASAALVWIKPALPNDPRFKTGFDTMISLVGSRYTQPAANGPRVMLEAQGGLGLAHFEGGGLAAAFAANLQLSLAGKFTADLPNTTALAITLNPATGVFTGRARPSGSAAPVVFSGAVVTKANEGFGYYLGATSSGAATIKPR